VTDTASTLLPPPEFDRSLPSQAKGIADDRRMSSYFSSSGYLQVWETERTIKVQQCDGRRLTRVTDLKAGWSLARGFRQSVPDLLHECARHCPNPITKHPAIEFDVLPVLHDIRIDLNRDWCIRESLSDSGCTFRWRPNV
jgi:hypothetical protein